MIHHARGGLIRNRTSQAKVVAILVGPNTTPLNTQGIVTAARLAPPRGGNIGAVNGTVPSKELTLFSHTIV